MEDTSTFGAPPPYTISATTQVTLPPSYEASCISREGLLQKAACLKRNTQLTNLHTRQQQASYLPTYEEALQINYSNNYPTLSDQPFRDSLPPSYSDALLAFVKELELSEENENELLDYYTRNLAEMKKVEYAHMRQVIIIYLQERLIKIADQQSAEYELLTKFITALKFDAAPNSLREILPEDKLIKFIPSPIQSLVYKLLYSSTLTNAALSTSSTPVENNLVDLAEAEWRRGREAEFRAQINELKKQNNRGLFKIRYKIFLIFQIPPELMFALFLKKKNLIDYCKISSQTINRIALKPYIYLASHMASCAFISFFLLTISFILLSKAKKQYQEGTHVHPIKFLAGAVFLTFVMEVLTVFFLQLKVIISLIQNPSLKFITLSKSSHWLGYLISNPIIYTRFSIKLVIIAYLEELTLSDCYETIKTLYHQVEQTLKGGVNALRFNNSVPVTAQTSTIEANQLNTDNSPSTVVERATLTIDEERQLQNNIIV